MYVITRILTTIALLNLGLCMDLPAPVHLALSSQYFVHLLSWKMGPGSPDGVHYKVTVQALEGGELAVKECEKVIFPLQCNLTEVFSNVDETYYVNVTAVLGNRTSPSSTCDPFKPIYNTTFEPPLLTVTTYNGWLYISPRAPAEKLHKVYSSLKFDLTISSEDGSEFHVITEGLNNVTQKNLAPGRRYCVNVSISALSITALSPPNRPEECAFIPERPNVSDAIISVILCLLMVLLVMSLPRLVSRCFCLKDDLPAALGFCPEVSPGSANQGPQTHLDLRATVELNSAGHCPSRNKIGHHSSAVNGCRQNEFKQSSIKSRDKVLLITAVESMNKLCVEISSMGKIKTSEDGDMEEEAEEVVKCARAVEHYLNTRGSPLSVVPVSSSSVVLMNQTPDTSSQGAPSLILFKDSHIRSEPTASPRLPNRTSALQKLASAFPTHVEHEDRESSADVNLFSVMLGGVSDKAEPDKTCNTDDVQESCPQQLSQTCATSTWISDAQTQNSQKSIQMNSLEEDDDGYLSRN